MSKTNALDIDQDVVGPEHLDKIFNTKCVLVDDQCIDKNKYILHITGTE